MKQVQLLFCNNVLLDDELNMKLDYSLTENVFELDEKTSYYGAKITKYLGDTVESDEECWISTSKDMVISIIQKLHQFQVTPISMVEIVDELVTTWAE